MGTPNGDPCDLGQTSDRKTTLHYDVNSKQPQAATTRQSIIESTLINLLKTTWAFRKCFTAFWLSHGWWFHFSINSPIRSSAQMLFLVARSFWFLDIRYLVLCFTSPSHRFFTSLSSTSSFFSWGIQLRVIQFIVFLGIFVCRSFFFVFSGAIKKKKKFCIGLVAESNQPCTTNAVFLILRLLARYKLFIHYTSFFMKATAAAFLDEYQRFMAFDNASANENDRL